MPKAPCSRSLGTRIWHAVANRASAWRITDADAQNGLTSKTLALDLCERAFVSTVFLSFVYRMFSGVSGPINVITVLVVMGETLPFIYIILRAPSITMSQRPTDWCFGILGTVMPMLVSPAGSVPPLVPLFVCSGFMIAGISLQLMAKLVLGRSFGIIAANRGVKVLGPYRIVRHPMYAGYTMMHVGFLLAMPSLSNALLYVTALAMQIVRILREERVLGQDVAYRTFATRVRYRLVPGIF
jgi:protein-S-isoprenylcysteine O-methyltransferase Ste14